MKKLLAIVFAALLLCVSFGAMADVINWSDAEAIAVQIDADAQFHPVADLGIMMWIPTAYEELPVEDEEFEEGYFLFMATEDEAGIFGCYMDLEGMTLSDYAAALVLEGYADASEDVVNGLPCVTYSDPEEDYVVIMFQYDEETAVMFGFTPISDDASAAVAAIMMASFQPVAE